MNRYFADISNNNASFDARAYRKAGHVLIAMKATEGTSFKDGDYRKWRHEAHEAGLIVAHYHFARPEAGRVDAEVQNFVNQIHGGVGAHDVLIIDVESGSPQQAYVNRFAAELHKFYPHYPLVLYRSLGNFTNLSLGRNWYAAYSGRKMALMVGIRTWAHQFTNGQIGAAPHTCAGIGHCDVSRLNMRSYLRMRRIVRRGK